MFDGCFLEDSSTSCTRVIEQTNGRSYFSPVSSARRSLPWPIEPNLLSITPYGQLRVMVHDLNNPVSDAMFSGPSLPQLLHYIRGLAHCRMQPGGIEGFTNFIRKHGSDSTRRNNDAILK